MYETKAAGVFASSITTKLNTAMIFLMGGRPEVLACKRG